VDLREAERDRAVPVLKDSFTGIMRWHAKRTLGEVTRVRAATIDGEVVGASLLEQLVPEVGYVYYVAVLMAYRRKGIATKLLDDALDFFRSQGVEVVYAAIDEENAESHRLFESRGFRRTERKETSYRDGGLGAWGLRSRMTIVAGEELFGLRLRAPSGARGASR
jgi:ribosomal protein S18 acetylase RimI-like enzyme